MARIEETLALSTFKARACDVRHWPRGRLGALFGASVALSLSCLRNTRPDAGRTPARPGPAAPPKLYLRSTITRLYNLML